MLQELVMANSPIIVCGQRTCEFEFVLRGFGEVQYLPSAATAPSWTDRATWKKLHSETSERLQ